MKRFTAGIASGLLVAIVSVSSVFAASGTFSQFGDATVVSNPNGVQLRSVGAGFGGIDYQPASPFTFSQLSKLSTDFQVTQGDCGGGSPRFQVNVVTPTGTKNIFVAIGPSPNFTGCGSSSQSTGNLIGNNDAGRYDLGQIGGSSFTNYSAALALAGNLQVTGIQLVVDAGWKFGTQTVIVNNVMINNDTFSVVGPPTSKDDCKDGGWQKFKNPTFKNQGDCVSFVETGGKTPGNGH